MSVYTEEVNRQLMVHRIMVNKGRKVDASITQSERKPRVKKAYTLSEDQPERVDKEARWTVKNAKPYYGYKKHLLTNEAGLVQAVETTSANTHDSQALESLIDKAQCKEGSIIEADKAYKSLRHDQLLKEKGLLNGIQHRALRNRPLSAKQKEHHKQIAKSRYKVERTFALWYDGLEQEYADMWV